ncbi:MAG: hypothetical protein DI535_05230 [Citrobacter freundii]|nr:MAG: hypothetical protein DI535_05230 [Citrobacter freundii]
MSYARRGIPNGFVSSGMTGVVIFVCGISCDEFKSLKRRQPVLNRKIFVAGTMATGSIPSVKNR